MRPKCLTVPEIEERLNAAGVAPTAQRIAICRYVLCQSEHPTAERVKLWADRNFPKMSLATVYNTLGTLVQAGLLKEIRLPHLESAVYDCNVGKHFHFVDEKTGEITDVDAGSFQIPRELEKAFHIREMEVVLRGTRRT